MERLNWDDLRIVLAVAHRGSVSGAARQLGIDQSTVGRRLTALEGRLGTILFLRSRQGFQPTDAGALAVARAERIDLELNGLVDALYSVNSDAAGLVRIVTNPWLVSDVLVPSYPDFRALNPNVEVRFIGDTRPRSLSKREADLGLWFEMEAPENVVTFAVGDVPYGLFKPAGRAEDTLPWVSFWVDDAVRAPMRWMSENEPASGVEVVMTSNDARAVVQGVRSGVGKGLLPLWLAAGDPRMERIAGEGAPPELVRTLHGHCHPDLMENLRVKSVITWLRTAISSRMRAVF